MKLFLISALVALASANVHEFWAEHNVMCETCKASVTFSLSGGKMSEFLSCKDKTGKVFTTVCGKVAGAQKEIFSFFNEGMKEEDICRELNLCGDWSDNDFETMAAADQSMVDAINNDASSTWKAELPMRFHNNNLAQIRKQLGAVVDPDHTYQLPPKSKVMGFGRVWEGALPTNFDSRLNWPYCASIIGHVRDQSSCGSCWAFGSTESFNDRLCIQNVTANHDPFLQLMSVEDTTACCSGISCGFSNGCNGGQPTAAWEWFETAGCPSGGDYGDIGESDTCEPYTLPECAHHVTNASYTPCPTTEYHTPKCVSSCSNKGYSKTWAADKHHASASYSIRSVNAMMQDLVEYRSISVAFTVYQDFLSYKSGVYVHHSGQALGGHAVKIFGYGVDNGVDYWWVMNSWNDSWGDNGFFKIKKGVNECGIESDASAGHPKN